MKRRVTLSLIALSSLLAWHAVALAEDTGPLESAVAAMPTGKPVCALAADRNRVASGQAVRLSARCSPGVLSYTWFNAAFDASQNAGQIFPQSTGHYHVVGFDGRQYSDPAGVTITVVAQTTRGKQAASAAPSSAAKASAAPSGFQGAAPLAQAAVRQITAGTHHTAVLKNDGTVWNWGKFFGHAAIDASPVQVPNIRNVVAVSTNGGYSIALKDDGSVWAWGRNEIGALGNGSFVNSSTPVRLVMEGGVPLNGIIQIVAGGGHNLALHNDGTVWAWGRNERGQLGISSTVHSNVAQRVKVINGLDTSASRNVAIAAGVVTSMVLKADGTVWTWGDNTGGQLGVADSALPGTPAMVVGLRDVTAIAAGSFHILALTHDASVWAWGSNANDELGNGMPFLQAPIFRWR